MTTTTATTVYADNLDAGKRSGMSDRAAAAFANAVVARCVARGLFAAANTATRA